MDYYLNIQLGLEYRRIYCKWVKSDMKYIVIKAGYTNYPGQTLLGQNGEKVKSKSKLIVCRM